MPEETRNLTDADVKAIADEMETRMVNRFYNDLGRGVWGMVWKAIIVALIGLAALGSVKGIK
ncbi:hypothetical protein [Massilia sp. TS11]|uniref:hypothetical protein n=1 Tax=Massilia sp. TS11 TaxID=2908003 RepID=UPI001EDA7148|nr:hypothetical protein [Massilia sp. TS11]MCG2585522.1 hypothetical protein [Massilia sp. TS11]